MSIPSPAFPQSISVRRVAALETFPLRQEVLRPGAPLEAVAFDGDDLPSTIHLGCFQDEALLSICSLYQRPCPTAHSHICAGRKFSWQLRGMATAPAVQGKGFGSILLLGCFQFINAGPTLLWCNARTSAVPFYRKHGFHQVGEEFIIPEVGPHYVMYRTLG